MWSEIQFLIIQTQIFYDEMKSLNQKPKNSTLEILNIYSFSHW